MKTRILLILAALALAVLPARAQEYKSFEYDGPTCEEQAEMIRISLDQAWARGIDPEIDFLYETHRESCLKIPPPEPLKAFSAEWYALVYLSLIDDFEQHRPDDYFTDSYKGRRNQSVCRRVIISEIAKHRITDPAIVEQAKETCINTVAEIHRAQMILDRIDKGEDSEVSALIDSAFSRDIRTGFRLGRIKRVIASVGVAEECDICPE